MYNHYFWKARFRDDFIASTRRVESVFLNRIMPTFSTVEAESEALTQQLWDEAMAQPYYGDGPDEGDIAEAVQDAGVSHYLGLKGMEQGILNCCALFLYHLFEQHLMTFHRKELLDWRQQHDSALFTHKEIHNRLKSAGVQVNNFKNWSKLEELRKLANAIKHAEGKGSQDLLACAPRFFQSPALSGGPFSQLPHAGRVYTPLVGDDIYVTPDDIRDYTGAIEGFWLELSDSLETA